MTIHRPIKNIKHARVFGKEILIGFDFYLKESDKNFLAYFSDFGCCYEVPRDIEFNTLNAINYLGGSEIIKVNELEVFKVNFL